VSSIAFKERRRKKENRCVSSQGLPSRFPLSYAEGGELVAARSRSALRESSIHVRPSRTLSLSTRISHPTRAAMPSFPQFNPMRIRSYIFRLPLCTRGLIAAILGLYIATIPFPWLRDFAALEPAKMDLTQSMSSFHVGMRGATKSAGRWFRHTGKLGRVEDGSSWRRTSTRRSAEPRKSFKLERLEGRCMSENNQKLIQMF
jgi:hypothetical protein